MSEEIQPFTLRAAAGLPPLYGPLSDAVLIVIDAQMEYTPEGALSLPDLGSALNNIEGLLLKGRKDGAEIVHIAHEGSEGRAFDPAAGGRIIGQVAPLEGETVLTKGLPNGFAHSGLQNHLAGIGRPHLVICGFTTHMCVSSTARVALDLGYETTVVSDATATRALPSTDGGEPISAHALHRSALAALADRFSAINTTVEVLAAGA
ncbi:MAG: nicotinamidase-related amidase [Verrucomicrobiales bacterium]|jgi:nicotinamidase-related amidase